MRRYKLYFFLLLALPFSSCSGGNSGEAPTTDSIKPEKISNPDSSEKANYSSAYLLGKFNPKTDTSFALVPLKYCNREGMYLRKETIAAFVNMYEAAKKEGVSLKIISATRNFDYQKGIWEAKWNGTKLVNGKKLSETIKDPVERARTILRYSSMPGTSRHHWGSDMDLNSLDVSYFNTADGKKIYEWLKKNAGTFGFCQPYSAKGEGRPNGYEEEKWHWSYMPLSSAILDEYLKYIKPETIIGFRGAETAAKLKIIEHYVNGINPECR